jgi:predicted HicB family RNase H-like nuclease
MPSERPKPIFLRLPPDLYEFVQKKAKKQDKTLQSVIVQVLNQHQISKGK